MPFPINSIRPRRQLRGFLSLWAEHRRPALIFAAVLFVLGSAGSLYMLTKYQAGVLVVMDKKGIHNEWELLLDDVRNVDFEQQIRSRAVLEPVLEEYKLINAPKTKGLLGFINGVLGGKQTKDQKTATAIESFGTKLSIERPRQSNILRIKIKDRNPILAADYANSVAQAFLNYRREQAVSRTERLIAGIDEEMKAIREQLVAKTGERNTFFAENGWDDYMTELKTSSQKVAGLKDAMRSLDVYREEAGKDSGAQNRFEMPSFPNEGGSSQQDASLIDVARRYVDVDRQLEHVSGSYREEHPGVLQARLEKEMLETMFKKKLKDPAERHGMLKKQLGREQENLQQLLSNEPRAQLLGQSIEYGRHRLLELMDQRAKAHFLLTQWAQQPDDSFDDLYVLDAALPPPSQSWGLMLPLVFLTAALLSGSGLVLVPIFLSFWGAELSRLGGYDIGPMTSLTERNASQLSGVGDGID
ncbi:MAG: hypothetical protein Q8R76_06855 [Candidatus Omnitrophota bacterium]|nr:hypothetical protein [Candidatus Omnitrophota bacterium]